MSCQACETFQDDPPGQYFFRWKNANVEIVACEQHAKEIMDVLREHQREASKNDL